MGSFTSSNRHWLTIRRVGSRAQGPSKPALNGVVPRPPVPLSIARKPVLVFAALLAMVVIPAALVTWPRDEPESQTKTAVRPEVAVAPAAGSYAVGAAVYREVDGVDVRLEPGARLALGDRLLLHLQTSVPVDVYVVNEDEMGDIGTSCFRSRAAPPRTRCPAARCIVCPARIRPSACRGESLQRESASTS